MAWPLPMAAHAWRSAARQLAACAVEAIAATAPARAAPLPTGLGSPAPAALLQQGALASTEACSTSTSTAQQRALRLHHRRAWRSQLLREEGHAAAGRQPPPSCSCQHQHQQQWLCRQQQQHAWLGQAWRRGFATESAAPAAAAAATAAGEAARKAKTKEWSTAAELGMYGAAACVAMIGFSYAAVPLYKVFCAATGYGGTVAGATTVEEKLKRRAAQPNLQLEKAAAQREVTVWFNADVADDMPWAFEPTQESVRVRPGQSALAFFTATNKSDKPVTGYSVYNVTPDKAANYFNKIQCFCFEEQRLLAGETVDMPVFFYLDPEMAADWNCRNVSNITLSYRFHKVDDEDLWDDEEEQPQSSRIKLHGGPGLAPLPGGTAAAMQPQLAAGGGGA